MVSYYIEYVHLRSYVYIYYTFCQIFQPLRLFPALRLFRRLEYAKFRYNLYCIVVYVAFFANL